MLKLVQLITITTVTLQTKNMNKNQLAFFLRTESFQDLLHGNLHLFRTAIPPSPRFARSILRQHPPSPAQQLCLQRTRLAAGKHIKAAVAGEADAEEHKAQEHKARGAEPKPLHSSGRSARASRPPDEERPRSRFLLRAQEVPPKRRSHRGLSAGNPPSTVRAPGWTFPPHRRPGEERRQQPGPAALGGSVE